MSNRPPTGVGHHLLKQTFNETQIGSTFQPFQNILIWSKFFTDSGRFHCAWLVQKVVDCWKSNFNPQKRVDTRILESKDQQDQSECLL